MNYQNVTDLPNNNTIFLVWTFKKDIDKTLLNNTFAKVCGLAGNLNNSVADRFPEGRASVTIGISHSAWLTLGLPKPLPKELLDYISFLEKELEVPIKVVSVGPDRTQTIIR